MDLEWSVDPAAVTECSLSAGPVRQIALNLLLNACAAAGQSGCVGLIARTTDGNLSLQITNTGAAMPQAALDRLLGDGPLLPGGGVGLRLVRDLVKTMGGAVCHAHENGVTRVTVSLPASWEARDAEG
ncbi:MAG: ATP-binding protein [Paracoccus sp. (in: a-proteobacteria)]|nr:ATP-binding protein [Paracoccus sp. (in: a-proteobacteria)]